MKFLIVSFDRSLTNQLKEALRDYEVVNVKNGEEALNLESHNFDVVIYDAIAGAISEEDINHMYEQKFKDLKFVILTDDLFPINPSNIKPINKVIILREDSVGQILKAIEQPAEMISEQTQPPTFEQTQIPYLEDLTFEQTQFTSFEDFGQTQLMEEYVPTESSNLSRDSYFEDIGDLQAILDQPPYQESTTQYIPQAPEDKRRIAIVSFENTLIDSIASLLPENAEITPVRSFRGLDDVLRDKDLVVFDAISGIAAKKRLTELSKDPVISSKPFVILIDELFSIDVTDIPLSEKYSISRSENPQKIAEKIVQILTSKKTQPIPTEEITPIQIPEKITQEKTEQKSFEELLGSVINFEPQEELLLEERKTEVEERFEPKEYTLPTFNEQIEVKEELIPTKKEVYVPPVSAEEIKQIIRQSIASIQPPAEEIRQIIRRSLANIGPVDEIVKEAVKQVLEGKLESILREEIRKAIENIPVEQIIKETAYQALRERLRELIT